MKCVRELHASRKGGKSISSKTMEKIASIGTVENQLCFLQSIALKQMCELRGSASVTLPLWKINAVIGSFL